MPLLHKDQKWRQRSLGDIDANIYLFITELVLLTPPLEKQSNRIPPVSQNSQPY